MCFSIYDLGGSIMMDASGHKVPWDGAHIKYNEGTWDNGRPLNKKKKKKKDLFDVVFQHIVVLPDHLTRMSPILSDWHPDL